MKQASLQYKQAMAKQFRDNAYGLLSVGVVNKQAQKGIKIRNTSYLSDNRSVVRLGESRYEYASFEENQTLANGQSFFPPKDDEYLQIKLNMNCVAENILSPIRITFGNTYDLKGFTFDFTDNYPTEFSISNGTVTRTYQNASKDFMTSDVFDGSSYIEITPIHFVNGDDKRLRFNYILMGVGLVFDNEDISEFTLKEKVSYVSDSLPSIDVTARVFDVNRLFNVDDVTSFINYLADGQELSVSLGQTLEDGTIEYIALPTTYLTKWGSNGMYMSFTAQDRFKLLDMTYSEGNYIHERTLYDDAIDVLTFAGLEPDEYFVDTVLRDVTITNPLPTAKCSECLQLIANAGRCSLRQGQEGKILLEGNFENIIEPSELIVNATNEAGWSNGDNVRFGSNVVYADFTRNFVCADGSMLFIPQDSNEYLEDTTYVSAEIADINGDFTLTPTITMELPAAYTYHSLAVLFNGNPPSEMTITSYYDDIEIETITVNPTEQDTYVIHSFIQFNKLVFAFTKGEPYNRILVNKIALGEITDYRLDRFSMKEEPVGVMEKKTKDVQVKVFTFNEPQEEGQEPEQVEDSVYGTYNINSTGQTVTFENQLISTLEHAERVAQWLGNYYANNVSYQVKYRGDPRLDAADIIYMDSQILNNLQVEIESLDLKFNGAYSGTLNLRRAVNMLINEEV